MFRDAWLMASKDLRIEWATRVGMGQILPFGGLVLILFGLAISPDLAVAGSDGRSLLAQAAPGLFWITVLLASLLALGRSFAVESADGNLDALKMAGLDPAGIFLGKSAAVAIQPRSLKDPPPTSPTEEPTVNGSKTRIPSGRGSAFLKPPNVSKLATADQALVAPEALDRDRQ